jgi:CxxC motif-containing protein (DUF1111 family)
MGLTSADQPNDDCTAAEGDCLQHATGRFPEVKEELLDAVVTFQRTLAVPQATPAAAEVASGYQLFVVLGCAACHRPRLPVELPEESSTTRANFIAPYTDLRLHDMGAEMSDESASGGRVPSRWRTAPLWGLGYRLKVNGPVTLLHDGRARSPEEAILWHSGEAAHARQGFMTLGPRARETLLRWLATL